MSADGITANIDQETGVITFTADFAETPLGNYVATVSCGEADPVAIAITATAPSIEELTYSGTQIKMTALNRDLNVNIIRSPNGSRGGEITCTIGDYNDNFTINRTETNAFNARYGYFYDKFVFRQTSSTGGTTETDATFTCGDITKVIPLKPYN